MYRYLCWIFIACCTISCQGGKSGVSSEYPTPGSTGSDISIYNPGICKIVMDSTFISSMYGKAGVLNNQLYYLDTYNSYLYMFRPDGTIQKRYLGVGNNPNEINCGPIAAYTFTSNGNLVIYGTSDDVYVYTNEYVQNKDASFRIRRDYSKMAENVKPDPQAFETYTFPRFMVCRSWNEKTYINNNSAAYGFNYFETPDDYSQNCRIITEYDIPNKKIGRLLGKGLPEIYQGTSDRNYIFSEFTFDIDEEGNFYVAFMADSLIYKFNKDFKPVVAFGCKGRNMDVDYFKVTNPKEIYPKANEQYESKGWYTWAEYIPEKNWFCRSYHKGAHSTTDGLQIYDGDNNLIADIDVPVGFKPIGYVHPYLYSDVIEQDEKLIFHKLRIGEP